MGLWVGVQGGLPPLGFMLQGALPHQGMLPWLSPRHGSPGWQNPFSHWRHCSSPRTPPKNFAGLRLVLPAPLTKAHWDVQDLKRPLLFRLP